MLIFVRNCLTGRTFVVEVESSSDTVGSVKAKLEELVRLPARHQHLIHSGRYLGDWHKLSDYNIVDQSNLHLMRRVLLLVVGAYAVVTASISTYRHAQARALRSKWSHQTRSLMS